MPTTAARLVAQLMPAPSLVGAEPVTPGISPHYSLALYLWEWWQSRSPFSRTSFQQSQSQVATGLKKNKFPTVSFNCLFRVNGVQNPPFTGGAGVSISTAGSNPLVLPSSATYLATFKIPISSTVYLYLCVEIVTLGTLL